MCIKNGYISQILVKRFDIEHTNFVKTYSSLKNKWSQLKIPEEHIINITTRATKTHMISQKFHYESLAQLHWSGNINEKNDISM